MVEYDINGRKIRVDTDKTYLDFFWNEDGQGQLDQLNLEAMLGEIQSGKIPVDDNLREYMQYLRRWEVDAPRKKGLREMRRSGMHVLTTDALFEEDGGEEIIDKLENTGTFAAYFLREVYGEE